MPELFAAAPEAAAQAPLAERMRPRSLDDYVGQAHLVGTEGPVRRLLESGRLPSLLFWGPPGVGKTTLARLLAQAQNRPFRQLSAVSAGVKEVREVLEFARRSPGTILFLDEIHRFNKAQQDALLPAVERGDIVLIGATTENPSFEVNAALRSRMQVYVLQALTQDELDALLHRACQQDDWLRSLQTELQETDALFALSGGDGRKALSLLELVAQEGAARALRHGEPLRITNEAVEAVAQARVAAYDKNGEQHYDVISAFIKSIRGGDPNAGVYWLARMLHGGEDPKFIARRLVILASEDIGNANPNALLLATGTFQAVDMIGMPEARIILSQCVTYLATSPKSNASYLAINQALDWVRQNPDHPVPLHLRNAPTDLMRQQGYGLGYKYSHEWDWQDPAANQEYLPEVLRGKAFYQPKAAGREADIRRYMAHKWKDPYGYE